MIRQLHADGYFPLSPEAKGLQDFHEFVVAAPRQVFWTLQPPAEGRELYDEDRLIGSANRDSVQLGSVALEVVLKQTSDFRSGFHFGAFCLLHPSEEIPLFLITNNPCSGADARRLRSPAFLTSVPNSVIKCQHNCVFIYNHEEVLVAQFLHRKKHPTDRKTGTGTIHVRADLDAQVQLELTAALFGISILF